MIAIIDSIYDFAPRNTNSCMWLYVDNNNALAAITRGDSPTDIIAITVARIWETIHRFSIHAWSPRARSKLNPADLPTHHKLPPYPIRKKTPFRNINELLIRARRELMLPLTLRRNELGNQRRNPIRR